MFVPRREPLRLEASRLLEIRFSLNTPVLRTADELPPGRAQAAVLVYADQGRQRLTVAIRSLEADSLLFFDLEDEVADRLQAIEAALSFGESMGFLFDDDALANQDEAGRRRALARCRALLTGRTPAAPPAPETPAPRPSVAEADPGPELWLQSPADEAESEPAPPPRRAAPARRAEVPLTKFRHAVTAEKPPEPPARPKKPKGIGRRAVGWVRLVRRVAQRKEDPPSDFLQLLGQF